VKAYALTEDDIDALGLLGGIAAFCFAAGTAAVTYALSTFQNVQLSTAEQALRAFWRGTGIAILFVGIILFIVGGGFSCVRGGRFARIRDTSRF
jgi:hypothetical protein